MSNIPYKIIEKTQPGVTGGGQKKFYAQVVHLERLTIAELCEEIADGRTLTETDVRAVILSLTRKIELHLAKGHLIELGDLGTITVSLSSEGVENEDDFTQSNIKKVRHVFRPGKDLKQSAKAYTFTKTSYTTGE